MVHKKGAENKKKQTSESRSRAIAWLKESANRTQLRKTQDFREKHYSIFLAFATMVVISLWTAVHVVTKRTRCVCAISSFGIETLNRFDVCEAIGLCRYVFVTSIQYNLSHE